MNGGVAGHGKRTLLGLRHRSQTKLAEECSPVSGAQPIGAQPISLCLEEQKMGVGRTTLYEKEKEKKRTTLYELFFS